MDRALAGHLGARGAVPMIIGELTRLLRARGPAPIAQPAQERIARSGVRRPGMVPAGVADALRERVKR